MSRRTRQTPIVRSTPRSTLVPAGVHRCRMPKQRDHRGRTWDQCDVILLDGTTITGRLDTTWGEYFYFVVEDSCYKGALREWNHHLDNTFDLRKERQV